MNKLPDIRKFKRIAIIQTAFLGDVALSLYLAEEIKHLNPDCELTFVTTPTAAALVTCAKSVDNVITFDKRGIHSGLKGIKFIANILNEKNIDCIFGLQRSIRTTLLTYFTKPLYSVGFDISTFSILYKNRIKYIRGIHEVERNLSLINAFENHQQPLINLESGIELEISDDDKNYIDNLFNILEVGSKSSIIAIAPGSVWETKRWLPEHFEKLILTLKSSGHQPILIGSIDDLFITDEIKKNTGCLSVVGKTTIPQLLYLLSLCKLTITNDSSPTHLAGLVKCKTLTIFGPTIPEFGFSPLGVNDKSLGVAGLKCRPCGIHGGRKCPIKTFDCMVNLSPEIVSRESLELISKI